MSHVYKYIYIHIYKHERIKKTMRGYQYNDNVSEYIQIKINRKIDRNRPIKYFPA